VIGLLDPRGLPKAAQTLGALGENARCGLVAGGLPAERGEVLETGEQITEALDRFGVSSQTISPPEPGWVEHLADFDPDICLILEPRYLDSWTAGERLQVRDARQEISLMGFPFTGPDIAESRRTANKVHTKRLAETRGVHAPASVIIQSVADLATMDLRPPVIGKPLDQGGGLAVRLCDGWEAIQEHGRRLLEEFGAALFEPYVDGVEISVPIFATSRGCAVLPLVEVELVSFLIFDELAKRTDNSFRQRIPARLAERHAIAIRNQAVEVASALEWHGLVRVDFIWQPLLEKAWFLEANGHPSLGRNWGITVPSARSIGLDQADVVGWQIWQGLGRL
jgi:D-alanine-D-alanine ligase